MEKHEESLELANKHFQIADHFLYMTFPLIKENKLLLKIIEEISLSILNTINAVLQFEYLYKRIQIYSSSRDNLETFKQISKRYSISSEQLQNLLKILELTRKHKESKFEFSKSDKIVIMTDGFPETLTEEKTKLFLSETRDFIKKARIKLRK